jgi:hypothetical protein
MIKHQVYTVYLLYEMLQVGITSQRNRWANTDPGHIGGGIKSLGGVSIPCRPVTLAVSPVSWSRMRSYPLSKSVCQIRSNYWYEKCQTTYCSMKYCNYKSDHYTGYKTCKTLKSNENIEIPATSTCISDSKTHRM